MWSSQAYIGRSSCLFKCGVLKHTLEGVLACFKCGRSSCLFKCGVLKHTLEGLLACFNVEFLSIHWNVFLLVLMWSSQAYIGGFLAGLNVEFSSIQWKVFLPV